MNIDPRHFGIVPTIGTFLRRGRRVGYHVQRMDDRRLWLRGEQRWTTPDCWHLEDSIYLSRDEALIAADRLERAHNYAFDIALAPAYMRRQERGLSL